jgi:hypothetical protein
MGHISLTHADDVNLLGDNIDTMKKNKGTLILVGIEVYAKKTKYMLLYQHQTARQNSTQNL